MNPEKDKIASTQQNVESIVDKTQRVEISVTNVKKKENTHRPYERILQYM